MILRKHSYNYCMFAIKSCRANQHLKAWSFRGRLWMLLSTYFLWCGDWGTTGFLTVTSAVPHTTFSASRLWASSLGIHEEISLATVLQDAVPALFRKLLPEMGNSCGDLRKRHLSGANNSMLYQQVHCVLIKIQVSARKGKEREYLLRAGYKAAIYCKSAGHQGVAVIHNYFTDSASQTSYNCWMAPNTDNFTCKRQAPASASAGLPHNRSSGHCRLYRQTSFWNLIHFQLLAFVSFEPFALQVTFYTFTGIALHFKALAEVVSWCIRYCTYRQTDTAPGLDAVTYAWELHFVHFASKETQP